ncbi:Bug family tripartite tricarboxylate transporter substrate binding protein [Pseudoroseomonas ludipueritiae]|uniref:Tripartite tricarboxylate transporter substrate binding protein n=1 Tax=Pseudoroseomonas ludipueritiae TaxID=198093 RepID=A0ABR7R401_9PROT|nr:tripartite tricarboxylate transporter substrate binding protein [Pseudoroseomonas ludipueritiae]MBC9176414.1 tripartite tricarboxylate transporter substrate binding protein [Pseudoroseomonas ludipueritiae]MCG7360923.1 tripartite tricarboxylate transporter substrate binding protein [Roseomonas sp. ACRSG]
MSKLFPRAALAAAMLTLAAPWAASPAAAQNRAYPTQPIRVIVPFSAGTSDTVARLVGQKMSETLGQPLVVESRPGAGGNIGSEACARATPDGYTICLGTISSHAINPSIFVKMPYDNLKDFAPITQLAAQPNALAVTNDLPAKNIQELITLLKANPGKYNYGSSGVGTSIHLAGALFSQLTGTEMEHVPYRGSGQIMTALLSGELPLAFDNFSSAWPFAKEGKIRILGVTSATRSQTAPDIPAIAETVPGFESLSWHGFFAPAGTPPEIVARLNKEAVAALKSDTVAARFRELGITPIGNTPEEFRTFIASETKRWGDVARNAKIQVE